MKAVYCSLIAIFFLIICFSQSSFAQNAYTKKVNITVVDSRTGEPVKDALVTVKGLIVKQKKTTGADGKAAFEVSFFTASLKLDIEVIKKNSFGVTTASLKDAYTVVSTQETYEITERLATKSGVKKLTVIVIDEKGSAVGGARVEIGHTLEYTQANGTVVFDEVPLVGQSILPLTVEKYGFSQYKSSVIFNETDEQYTHTATLKSDKGYKKVKVHAVSVDDSKPVIGAKIQALGRGITDSYTETTDANGDATLVFTSSGDFQVTAKHEAFFEESQSINVQHLDDDKNNPALQFSMRRKEQAHEGTLEVYVNDLDGNPLQDATISFKGTAQGWSNLTDTKGYAKLLHKLLQGEILNVKVSKEGYKTQERNVMVGENQRRVGAVAVPNDMARFTLQKGATGKIQFVVQVYDHATNKPIARADAIIKSYSGTAVSVSAQTSSSGEVSLFVDEAALINGQFRVIASANNYQEKWSDIPSELMKSTTGKRYLQLYLEPKKSSNPSEKYYGLFPVDLSKWVPTGVHVKKGAHFRVDASGFMFNPNAGKNVAKEMYPDGYGAWNWYVLAVRIGTNVIQVGKNGTGIAKEEGDIELGAPRSQNIFAGDDKDIIGNWKVRLYATDAEERPLAKQTRIAEPITISTPTLKPPPSKEKIEKAEKDVEFIKNVLKGEPGPNWTNPMEIAGELKGIISRYDLAPQGSAGNVDGCIAAITAIGNRNPSDVEKTRYYTCLWDMIYGLQAKIDNKQL